MLPIAVDAMGGDNAPAEIVVGARLAVDEGTPVLLVGRSEEMGDTGDIPILEASEVIAMDAEPGSSVRRMKDSSLVRAAEAVRDGTASAMVSAGNTGATMASALLRMGRIKGVSRPAIATLLPAPGTTPTVLLDAGANSECSPDWLVQFGQMGAVFATDRLGIREPRVALLSIGEEPGKGNPLVKEAYEALEAVELAQGVFIGNVEGRDLLTDAVDVVVTDGFTGNVTLKTLEGSMKTLITALFASMSDRPEALEAADVLAPEFDALYRQFHPDTYGGAILLGVRGVCIISHGSTGATAMKNAIGIAAEMVEAEVVDHLTTAVGSAD
ncbi:MAG: phosphate acyltransferase PlsX [Acidimicrobiales bacterium]|jgi:glycerol-3-phosphate acyltransferase PlsX|nr:phosphate--acyl-ACP acyltransferase [Acidimicrobiaceae bacterium]MDP6078254.1 phosphate acyltransferase PlsX [Acidimicrobiales bacterium]MDP7258783.1 phosphate acyltransferase PlsX [Acidimicrobiales bacterium]HCV37126.1 phosphate acyltransferase PlsX [Acidimicrobiaceae bacterium]HJO79205.1 phosphate acyltransferase PlsX [Acidimicrobiales bacterium]|tara:strand:+ start:2659 stop:3639 length:981 start_codon:yes stop_codon:yes gene_type:complete